MLQVFASHAFKTEIPGRPRVVDQSAPLDPMTASHWPLSLESQLLIAAIKLLIAAIKLLIVAIKLLIVATN